MQSRPSMFKRTHLPPPPPPHHDADVAVHFEEAAHGRLRPHSFFPFEKPHCGVVSDTKNGRRKRDEEERGRDPVVDKRDSSKWTQKKATDAALKHGIPKELETSGALWDCGSSLYDSFELNAFSNEFGLCLAEELRSSATAAAAATTRKPLLPDSSAPSSSSFSNSSSSSLEWATCRDLPPPKRRRCFLACLGGGGFSVVPSCFRMAPGFEPLDCAPVPPGSKRKDPCPPSSESLLPSPSSLPRTICLRVSKAAKACLFPSSLAADPRHRYDAHLRHMVHHHHHHLLIRRHRHNSRLDRTSSPFLREFAEDMAVMAAAAAEEDHEGELVAAKLLKQFREEQARACISPRTLAAALRKEMERQHSNLKYHTS